MTSSDGISRDDLAERGNLTSDQHRAAYGCESCRRVWYAQDGAVCCPFCGSEDVGERDLPGAILLNPGVEWPEDDPFVGGSDA